MSEYSDSVPTQVAMPIKEHKKIRSFGHRIRRLRIKKDLTQGELADKAGVTKATISWWEQDEKDDCMAKPLVKAAAALGTTVEYLMTGKDRYRK